MADLPTYIHNRIKAGQMTLRQARERLYWAGYFDHVPTDEQVEQLLKLN